MVSADRFVLDLSQVKLYVVFISAEPKYIYIDMIITAYPDLSVQTAIKIQKCRQLLFWSLKINTHVVRKFYLTYRLLMKIWNDFALFGAKSRWDSCECFVIHTMHMRRNYIIYIYTLFTYDLKTIQNIKN